MLEPFCLRPGAAAVFSPRAPLFHYPRGGLPGPPRDAPNHAWWPGKATTRKPSGDLCGQALRASGPAQFLSWCFRREVLRRPAPSVVTLQPVVVRADADGEFLPRRRCGYRDGYHLAGRGVEAGAVPVADLRVDLERACDLSLVLEKSPLATRLAGSAAAVIAGTMETKRIAAARAQAAGFGCFDSHLRHMRGPPN